MASYLDRYLGGEHEAVWAELLAQGERVRAEPLASDALAVAREMMGRVRTNLELHIPRLAAINYQPFAVTSRRIAHWLLPCPSIVRSPTW